MNERAERAKQFAPFDALRGFRDALREKERIVVPKPELSEEMKEELDQNFSQVKLKDIITVVYFQKDECLKVTGMVSRISITSRTLQIVNTKINLDDICEISWP